MGGVNDCDKHSVDCAYALVLLGVLGRTITWIRIPKNGTMKIGMVQAGLPHPDGLSLPKRFARDPDEHQAD